MSGQKGKKSDFPISLALLALPECSGSILYSLFDVLSSVGGLWTLLTGQQQMTSGFSVQIVAPMSTSFLCHAGVPVIPHSSFEKSGAADVIIVPDLVLLPGFQPDENWRASREWLLRQYESGAIICSVCTGAALLADSGLLDGKKATTHWSVAEMFCKRWPLVELNLDKIFVLADEEHRLITTGGAASWIELTLYLVKRFFGYQESLRIAKIYLLGDRSDGQLPFAVLPASTQHQDAVIEECQLWLAERYAEPTPVRKMMVFSGLPERTFKRRFALATGLTPVEYVQNLRIEEAKQFLEATQTTIETISVQVGYEDPAYFRRLFKRKAGVTPSRYRTKFQAIRYLGEARGGEV